MANRYWVGGSGTWDNSSTTNWSTSSGGASGASAPTTADAAIFDANSNTGTNDFTVTLGTSPACLTLNTTGIDPANAMTVAGTGNLTVAGLTFTLTNKVLWTNTGTITFTSTSSTTSITTAGVSIASNVSFGGASGSPTYRFQDDPTITGSVTLTRGTLNSVSGLTLNFASFLTTGTNTKSVSPAANTTLNITGNAATIFDLVTGATGLTWGQPTTINFTYSGSTGTRTIAAGSTQLTTNTLNISAGSDTVVFTSGDSIGPLNFTGFTGTWNNVAMTIGNSGSSSLTTVSGMTTGSGTGVVTMATSNATLVTGGITYNFPLTINNPTAQTTTLSGNLTLDAASTLTLTSGTLACGTNSVSVGRYSQTAGTITKTTATITLTGNAATVLTLTGGTATSFTFNCTYSGSTGTRTFNVTTQTPTINISAGSDTVTFTASNTIGALSFTGFAGTWSNVAMTVTGSLTIASGMTVTAGANTVTVSGASTITSNGKTLDFPFTMLGAGTKTLADALTVGSTRLSTLSAGTLALGNNTFTTGQLTVSGSAAITRGTGNITITGNAATILTYTTSGALPSGLIATCNYSGSTGTRTFNVTAGTSSPKISVTAGSDIVVFTASNSIAALDFTGFTGTWNNVALTINGALTTSSGMTTGSGANAVTLATTSTLTTNGITYNFPLTLSGSITITLSGNLTLDSASTLTIGANTLACGANNVTVGRFSLAAAGSITKTTPTVTLTGNAATILLLTAGTATGFTFNCNYSGSTGTRTFNVTTQTPNINITAGSDIVVFNASNTIGALNFTGFTGSWTNAAISISGSLTTPSGMTVSAGGNAVTFIGSGTITSNGKTLDFPVTINGSGITTTLNDNLTVGSTRVLTLTQGTLAAVTYNVTTGTFASSNSNTRTLALGSGTWTVSGAGASAWDCSTSTNLTVTGSGTISMTSGSAKTFAGGSKTWPILENSGAGALTISGSNTFTTIQNSVQPTTFTFTAGTTQTVTNFNVSGTAGNLVTINSSSAGSQATLSKSSGMVNANYLSLQDSNATGGATWFAGYNSTNVSNNTGWYFSSTTGNFLMFM